MKTIRRGDKGKEVKTAQQLLNHKGYGAGSVDGIFGENTEKAVRALQKNYGITVDGIIGTDTWDSLEVDGVLKQGARGPKVRGLQNALTRLVDLVAEQTADRAKKSLTLVLAYCNCPERAASLKAAFLSKCEALREVLMVPTGGLSTVYANNGGVVVAF